MGKANRIQLLLPARPLPSSGDQRAFDNQAAQHSASPCASACPRWRLVGHPGRTSPSRQESTRLDCAELDTTSSESTTLHGTGTDNRGKLGKRSQYLPSPPLPLRAPFLSSLFVISTAYLKRAATSLGCLTTFISVLKRLEPQACNSAIFLSSSFSHPTFRSFCHSLTENRLLVDIPRFRRHIKRIQSATHRQAPSERNSEKESLPLTRSMPPEHLSTDTNLRVAIGSGALSYSRHNPPLLFYPRPASPKPRSL